MPASIAEAAYELALRAIEQQEKRLAELRSRSGTLLAAASIAGSVLGAQVARSGSLEPLAGLAVLAYVGCVLASLYVLAEHRLVLEFRGSVLLGVAEDAAASVDETLSAAAAWMEDFHEQNRAQLERLGRWYQAAVIAVGIEIVLWTLSLGDNLF